MGVCCDPFAASITEILNHTQTIAAKRNEYLCQQGEFGDSMYIVLEGTVAIEIMKDGRNTLLVTKLLG